MSLSAEQIQKLLRLVALTQSEETTCDDCFEHMAEFAEQKLSGQSIEEGLQAIEHHLAICSECHEEFEALRRALEVQD